MSLTGHGILHLDVLQFNHSMQKLYEEGEKLSLVKLFGQPSLSSAHPRGHHSYRSPYECLPIRVVPHDGLDISKKLELIMHLTNIDCWRWCASTKEERRLKKVVWELTVWNKTVYLSILVDWFWELNELLYVTTWNNTWHMISTQ